MLLVRMKCLFIFLFLMIICCEFSDENLQGPPETETQNKKTQDNEEKSESKEFVSSIEDTGGATAIRIEPAPDLTNEREQPKGKFIFSCFEMVIILF